MEAEVVQEVQQLFMVFNFAMSMEEEVVMEFLLTPL